MGGNFLLLVEFCKTVFASLSLQLNQFLASNGELIDGHAEYRLLHATERRGWGLLDGALDGFNG
jgi:hypothetical protein